jgi:hypothetical protein
MFLAICIVALAAGCASGRSNGSSSQPAGASGMRMQILTTSNSNGIAPDSRQSPFVKAGVDAKIKELRSPLNLTTEQETAIRAVFTQQMTDFFEPLTNRPSARRPLVIKSDRELIKPILTTQQLDAYDMFKDQQRKCRAEAIASAQLQHFQAPLRLDEDQIVQVFGIFNEQAQKQVALVDAGFVPFPDKETQVKTDWALQNVLTPLQFKQYQRLQRQEQALYTRHLTAADFMYCFLLTSAYAAVAIAQHH